VLNRVVYAQLHADPTADRRPDLPMTARTILGDSPVS
jgi:hypothetical protein